MSNLDQFAPPHIRALVEQRYYARVNEQARFEALIDDPAFLELGERHPGYFSDHGVVHMRDVAGQLLAVLDTSHGLLIPARSPERFRWMQGYGVLLACLHDIGMCDFSAFGRAMHPEAAAQAVYSPELADVMAAIWAEANGGPASRLLSLAEQGVLTQPADTVLRELLALSFCHSKSKAPITALNDPAALRALAVAAISTDLGRLHAVQQAAKQGLALSRAEADGSPEPDSARFYADVASEAFLWLTATAPALRELTEDAVDTIRALRCADEMRQRGTVLKTSGNYEILIDQATANAVYAFRMGDEQLFLIEMFSRLGAGEANIAGCELEPGGDLRVAFHRGRFSNPGATEYAVECAALVLAGMTRDIVDSFVRPPDERPQPGLKPAAAMCILLEETDDNPDFAPRVCEQATEWMPEMAGRLLIVPSLAQAGAAERRLYLAAAPFDWDARQRDDLLAHMGRAGHRVEPMDPACAFKHVKVGRLNAGQTLIEAGATAQFVYLPLEPGLEVVPLGGYRSFSVQPWMPLGLTGVIRGAERNASVIATRDLRLVIIPKSVYLEHWHHPYTEDTLAGLFDRLRAAQVRP